jgi:hypothetical protein
MSMISEAKSSDASKEKKRKKVSSFTQKKKEKKFRARVRRRTLRVGHSPSQQHANE